VDVAEPPFAFLVIDDGLKKVLPPEIRPVILGDPDL
jgi:hypothetical protein